MSLDSWPRKKLARFVVVGDQCVLKSTFVSDKRNFIVGLCDRRMFRIVPRFTRLFN